MVDDDSVDAQLYDALAKKNLQKVRELCRRYPDGPLHILTERKDTVLHLALYSMQVGLVLSLLEDNYLTPDQRHKLNRGNSTGNTILHEAATQDNCIAAAIRIMQLEPQLLTIPNKKGEFPIFRAVRYGQMKMFKFLDGKIEIFIPQQDQRIMFYKNTTKMKATSDKGKNKEASAASDTSKNKELSGTSDTSRNKEGDTSINKEVHTTYTILHSSIYHEHFELASYIARKFPYLVSEKNQHGMTGLQILSMNPSAFRNRDQPWLNYLVRSRPLAPSCRVPWWDTIRKERQTYEAAVKLANFLIEVDKSWIKKPKSNAADAGEKAKTPPTPLILATKWGCLEIVREILRRHPYTVEQADREYGSILHIAIKYRRIEILDMVEKMEMPMRRLVRKNDRDENSILHMVGENITNDATAAGSTLPWDVQQIEYEKRSPALELQDDLLLFERVEGILKTHYHKNVNSKGQTPVQVFAVNKEKLRDEAQEWLKRTAENCSIVAVLIATVAFAAAYTVPGGSNPDGSPVLINQTFFVVFTISDVLSLTFTLTAVVIFLSILTSSFRLQDFKESLPQKLMVGLTCLILSVTMMMLAFAATIILMIKNKEQWTNIILYTVAFLPVTVLAVSYLPLYVPLMRTFRYSLVKIGSFFPRFIAPESTSST